MAERAPRGEQAPDETGFRTLLARDVARAYADRRTLRQDFDELYRFYLDTESRRKLAGMGRFRRGVSVGVWIFGSLLRKLSPGRRLAVAGSLVIFVLAAVKFRLGNVMVDFNALPIGFFLLLVVLMLELKDKLLAKDEIAIAREVQLALLPSEAPRLAGWSFWFTTRPANDVGGDLIDTLERGEGRLGIALGDVAGKGLGAALLMAKLQATLRAVAPECVDLGVLGGRLNVILQRDGLANRFATLFYCEIECDRGGIRFVNAGHNPPFLLKGGRITILPAASIPLGILAGSAYAEERVDLAAGETLLVYSDGVTEARNAAGEEYGEERLRAVFVRCAGLPAAEAGERILREVDAFIGGTRPHDDLSLFVAVRESTRTLPV